jgi:hypothetical protein
LSLRLANTTKLEKNTIHATIFIPYKITYLLIPRPTHKDELEDAKESKPTNKKPPIPIPYIWPINSLNILQRMLSHSHLTKPIGQIFSNLYPKYVVQCIGGDNLTYHTPHLGL